jgi:hypothetical protein
VTLVLLVTALVLLARKWREVTSTLSRAQVALLCLLVAVLVLALTVPETRLMLPLMDAVGWDIFTILVAFQLRHHVAIAYRFCGAPILRLAGALMPSGARHAYYILRSGGVDRFSAPWWSIALFGARVALPVAVVGLSIPVLLVTGLHNSGLAVR